MPIDAWKSGDKMRSESWLIASFLLKTMFVCQTVLPMNVQEVSAQEMIENLELQLFDLNFTNWLFFVFKLWIWENGQLPGKTDVGATFVWLYFRRKEAEWKLKENKVLAFSTLQIFSCQWWKPTWTSAKVSSWVWLLVWSGAKDIFGILCKSNKTLPRPIHQWWTISYHR